MIVVNNATATTAINETIENFDFRFSARNPYEYYI